ncbi:flagellar hook protein FlgE [Spartinivicinus ruber]|uniref:flagellar hook protein FlgE n=1 Tax=Spartinivicinus ruber TaxID=2683272 RepID=UPI0013D86A8A|nr:flagellar hook-basal body complex protein [Spartinivicinus ruber]
MGFNTGLSGLKAATIDLDAIGNNIANGSTIGFKNSRAEFHDLFARSFGGSASKAGNGVIVQTVAQQFNQGNLKPTERNLDLSINGTGFFITRATDGVNYTRQGIFGVNRDGQIVTNTGDFLQGFIADATGAIVPGVLSDLQVGEQFQDPRLTSNVDISFNVDSRETVLATRGTTSEANGVIIANAQAGINNGYTAGSFLLQDVSQTPVVTLATLAVPSVANLSAGAIAAEIAQLGDNNGVISASANTRAKVDVTALPLGGAAAAGSSISINGQAVSLPTVNNVNELATAISNLTGISAAIDAAAPNEIRIFNNTGDDLRVAINNTGVGGGIPVQGATTTSFTNAGAAVNVTDGNTVTVGGELSFQLEEDIQVAAPVLPATISNVFNLPLTYTPFVENDFNPIDQATYNHATQVQIFDSLGNSHNLTLYFVKEPEMTSTPNASDWSMYVLIDGEDVGDPIVPGGTATRSRFSVQFDREGNLVNTNPIVITNWVPVDGNGDPINALQPVNISAGGDVLPLPEPPTSSNFVIDIASSTQFGSPFAVDSLTQNGFGVGRLTDLDVSQEGILFARYTNGQNSILGQLAMANFVNPQGLTPIGKTAWIESIDSGEPVVGAPGTGVLGSVESGSLEEANVDVAEELVNLIIAQRNYQANAKTIQTEDTITQTIINLR